MRRPQAIFVNLLIDQLWDEGRVLERVFPARIPTSIRIVRGYEDLGLFLGAPGDLVLGSRAPDPGFLELLALHGFRAPELLGIAANPYETRAWLEEASRIRIPEGSRARVAGLSALEESWIRAGKLERPEPATPASLQIQLNSKPFLVRTCRDLGISLPATRVLTTGQILRQGLPPFDAPHVLKAALSSGGGGSFRLASPKDPIVGYLTSRLEGSPDGFEWLLQEWHERKADYSCFGENGREPTLFRVEYDQAGASLRHFSPAEGEAPGAITRAFQLIGEALAARGHLGEYGTDGFVAASGEVFPAVDLNVRMTKPRLIEAAARCFGIPPGEIDSQRIKLVAPAPSSFLEGWSSVRSELGLSPAGRADDGRYLYPYLISSATRAGEGDLGPRPMELSFFVGVQGSRPAPEGSEWRRRALEAVGRWGARR